MYKMLFISNEVEPFLSAWGAWFACQPHENGYILPLGWEEELAARGIAFEVIEIPIEQPSNDYED